MAITIANKTSDTFTVDATSFAATSSTPVSGGLYFVAVENSKATTPDVPTVSGTNGYNTTWTQVATVAFGTVGAPQRRVTLFYGVAVSNTAGVITANYAGATQTGAIIAVDEAANFNAAAPVTSNIQTGSADTVGALGLTMAALASTLNAVYAAFARNANSTINPDNTFTELSDAGHASPVQRLQTEWKINDTNPSASQTSGTSEWGGIAIEINEASVGGAADQPWSRASQLQPFFAQ